MILCNWVQNRLPASIAGELPARQSRWVHWHVSQCHVCQKALKALKHMQGIVSQALPMDMKAPDTLNSRVLGALDNLPPPSDSPPRRRLPFWRR